jgi:membrane protein YqaA with SNARE-associated domain
MLTDLIYNFGYLGIMIISFLASSILPLSSEVFVFLMIKLQYNLVLILIFASIWNFLGSLTNYYIGLYWNKFIFSKWIKVDLKKKEKISKFYNKRWAPILFFSWLPIVWDILCVIAWWFKLKLLTFTIRVLSGKIIRYIITIWGINYFVSF